MDVPLVIYYEVENQRCGIVEFYRQNRVKDNPFVFITNNLKWPHYLEHTVVLTRVFVNDI